MRNRLFVSLGILAVIQILIFIFVLNGGKHPLASFSIFVAFGIIGLASYVATIKPKTDAQGSTQQYILATTIQLLAALGYTLFAKFSQRNEFKVIAIQFRIEFLVVLFVQSFFLLKELRKPNI